MIQGRIPSSFIQDVIAKTDIAQLIGARIALKKNGGNYSAPCPFHQEKTPSFHVNTQKQFYHCFGCGAGGNAISFLMNYDRLPFLEALTQLASALGLEVPRDADAAQHTAKHEPLYALLGKLAGYYYRKMCESPETIAYLKARGIDGVTAKRFQIGYAPKPWNYLATAFRNEKLNPADLITTGMLIQKDDGSSYCRFRDRLMFPIRDARGRVIGFGGRQFKLDNPPKYLNSPETPIFHKSFELFGLYEAKQSKHALDEIILVEGYLDVITLSQFGIHNVVATLGTAINTRHMQTLLRHTQNILVCFDADSAGRTAAWKALLVALPLMHDGISLRFLLLPDGEDPDSFVQKNGTAAFLAHSKTRAQSLADFFFEHIMATNGPGKGASSSSENPTHPRAAATPENLARIAKQAHDLLKTVPRGIFSELLYQRLAQIVGVPSVEQLMYLIEGPPAPASFQTAPNNRPTNALQAFASDTPMPPHVSTPRYFYTPDSSPAQTAIGILLHQPELAALLPDLTPLRALSTHPNIEFLLHLDALLKKNPMLTTGQIFSHFDALDHDDPNASFSEKQPLTTRSAEEPSSKYQPLLNQSSAPLAQRTEHQGSAHLAHFTSHPRFHIDLENAETLVPELEGAIHQLFLQVQKNKIQKLIDKSKSQGLMEPEKQELQELLRASKV